MDTRSWAHWWICLEALSIILLSICLNIHGIDIFIESRRDCDRTFNLTENGEVNIKYKINPTFSDCSVRVEHKDTLKYPKICSLLEVFETGSCQVDLYVHKGFVIDSDGYEDQKYTCNSTSYEELCTYLDSITVIFKPGAYMFDSGVEKDVSIEVKMYSRKSDSASDDEDDDGPNWRLILYIASGVASVLSCLCFTIYRCLKYNSQARQAMGTEYPSVQYNNASQPVDAGYQPNEGFQQTGFEPVDHRQSGDGPHNRNINGEPSEAKFCSPPPTYQQAMEMNEMAEK